LAKNAEKWKRSYVRTKFALFSVFGEVFFIKEEREKSALSQQKERERESEKKKGENTGFAHKSLKTHSKL